MGKIFVTGATGTNGKALVKKLTERKIDFVVGSRNVEKAKIKKEKMLKKELELKKRQAEIKKLKEELEQRKSKVS
jgi:nucleoside-diphosphate-sugar epimerase